MAFKSLVTIGEFNFPEPSQYSGQTSTVVDSGRNSAGIVVGGIIREDVAKVEISWNYLTVKQWADILKCFSVARGGNFYNDVTFFCQDMGDWITRKMYVGDRKANMFRRDPKTGDILGYVNCTLNLIEV